MSSLGGGAEPARPGDQRSTGDRDPQQRPRTPGYRPEPQPQAPSFPFRLLPAPRSAPGPTFLLNTSEKAVLAKTCPHGDTIVQGKHFPFFSWHGSRQFPEGTSDHSQRPHGHSGSDSEPPFASCLWDPSGTSFTFPKQSSWELCPGCRTSLTEPLRGPRPKASSSWLHTTYTHLCPITGLTPLVVFGQTLAGKLLTPSLLL